MFNFIKDFFKNIWWVIVVVFSAGMLSISLFISVIKDMIATIASGEATFKSSKIFLEKIFDVINKEEE